MHSLNKPLASVCEVVEHEEPILKMIQDCKIRPKASWDSALEYPNKEAEDALLFVFKQIGAQEAGPAEATEYTEAEESVNDSPERAKEIPFAENKDVHDKGYLTLSLSDPAMKFAVSLSYSNPVLLVVLSKLFDSF
jgi:protein kinase C substrate 80K-H